MRLTDFLIPLAGLGFLAAWAPMATAGEERPVVILLGDSIRIGYQRVVISELAGKANVWAPKANCKHTQFTLEHIEEWVKGRKPAVVHINCGLHDLFLSKATGKPRHSLDVYADNLRAIFEKLRRLTDAKIIFALTTAVDEERQATSKTYGRVVRRNAQIAVYNAKAKEIAGEFNVRVNDLYAVVQEGGVDVMLIDDGIHLSPEGAQRVGKQVAQSILAVLGGKADR
ncbi:MAG: SGNH/GDSL hydrolase family protein [Planctomycetes bacterium]|nr:SGNH/GDSL hydrolase family protein [Planctomycetota bacterium]